MAEVRGPQRSRRDELLEFANTSLSLRWLALTALIAHDALSPTPALAPVWLYIAILTYTLALQLYAWRFPYRAAGAARWGVLFDLAAITVGILVGIRAHPYVYLGYAVAVAAGLLTGHFGATAVAVVVAGLQWPGAARSIFPPDQYLVWGIAALSLLAAGNGAASAALRLERSTRLAATLRSIHARAAAVAGPADIAGRAIADAAAHFRAASGSLMVYSPRTDRLEIIAAHGLSAQYQDEKPRLGEGIAGWVAREGRPVLLTPNSTMPVPLQRSEIGSSMVIPISTGGRLLGVLNLNRAADRPWFALEDLDAADLAAQQMATILEQTRQARARTEMLHELADGFNAVGRALARDPAVLWPVLLDQARHLAEAEFTVLALEREDTGTVDIIASRGISGSAALVFLPGLLAASTDGRSHTAGQRDGGGAEVACVPLQVEGRTIGAMAFGLAGPAGAEQLLAVAGHVAAAVSTVRTAHRVADIGVVEERRRIAREMHDGLAQTLADALLQTDLTAMTAQSNPGQLTDMKELRGLLERGMRELREFMTELRKEMESGGDLPQALEAIGKEFQRRAEIPTEVVVTGETDRLPSAVRHSVLAIVRHALTNIRTHASATAVTIRADISSTACTASVTDNGVGFDVVAHRARPPVPQHLGLTSMEERAALVGGRLQIDSAPGRGTTVTIHIPLGG